MAIFNIVCICFERTLRDNHHVIKIQPCNTRKRCIAQRFGVGRRTMTDK
ncbi:MAG: hypothetical protein HOI35_15060 [Woeseia sp.]|nr:hypothetical protein [Woeseia sp.]MBT6211322.1 hypothetical protein [Woeseia sp.]